ncbi:MAG: RHS repeat-associated core domain-containing protein, partial [Defluviitaleaceae bacterium]|nr:RHS repeat-associated core domain-containing protein [Defluviitaleaceae bacterium]
NLTQTTQNGQLTASYTFDATNMMVSAHNPAKGSAEYTYDGFRNRVKKLENLCTPQAASAAIVPDPTKEVRYVLDMTRPYDNLLMTQGHNQHTQSFIWGNSLLSVTTEDSNLHYLQDHLGSPIRLLNADSEAHMAYDAFGVPTVDSMQNSNPFGFTGYQTDDISSMYYAQARYFIPTLGRFGAQDAVCDGINYYLYCNANPLKYVDKNGLWSRNIHEDITRHAGQRAGLSEYITDVLAHYVRLADEESSLWPYPGGTYGLHFNANSPNQVDSRIQHSENLLAAAIGLANGTGNPLSCLIGYDVLARAIYNAGFGIDMDAIASNSLRDAVSRGEIHPNAARLMPTTLGTMTLVHYVINCPDVGAQVRQELALLHIGVALHALQDIDAHGQIGAGSRVGHGHALQSALSLINLALNPDALNYIWRPGSQTWLIRPVDYNFFRGRVDLNPRSVSAILRSVEFINRFACSVNDTRWLGICD